MIDTEEAAFLRMICDDPADDAPRLVYADWLDDHGRHAQAEFIRVQCELARLAAKRVELFNDEVDWEQCTGVSGQWCPNCGDCCCRNREQYLSDDDCPLHGLASKHCCWEIGDRREAELTTRERELLGETRWFDLAGEATKILRLMQPYPEALTLRRGFVSLISCTLADWQEHGPAIVAQHPVERVVLTDCDPTRHNHSAAWYCSEDDTINHEDELPRDIWNHLRDGEDEYPWRRYGWGVGTALALADLSTAAIDWARMKAGQRPLRQRDK